MIIQAFPFAVARNRELDWRPLLAPSRLIELREAYALVLQSGEDSGEPVSERKWRDRSGQWWTLVFRKVPATGHFVGEDVDQLKDRFGRKLDLVEGYAIPGRSAGIDRQAMVLLDEIHKDAVDAFRAFWPLQDENLVPVASNPRDFRVPELQRPEFAAHPKPRRSLLALLAEFMGITRWQPPSNRGSTSQKQIEAHDGDSEDSQGAI